MNFFGHAVVARWLDSSPAFVLGAMLPDFATMLRTRPPTTTHDELLSGIKFHHRTDEAFHDSVVFRELTHEAFLWLSEHGLRRGSARAVAHIGVEIFLDGSLAHDSCGCEAYLSALHNAEPNSLGQHLRWENGDVGTRFDSLCRILCERGVMTADVAPELVAERLTRALFGRPRLALDEPGQGVVRDWVLVARGSVASRASSLIEELRTRL